MTAPPKPSFGPDLRPRPLPPALPDPTPAENQLRWNWGDLPAPQAGDLAQMLGSFVDFYNGRYAWTRDHTIPPCWAQHGALIEELTTLMWSRWAAFQGPLASPEAAQMWHTYHLPLFAARIITWIGAEAAADCRSGHHQPSRLPTPDMAERHRPPPQPPEAKRAEQ